ncbi:ClpP family protease [Sporomusa sp. KB1]|jgi:ATP-dependent protease ClpP protease subunit|uniref:ClpP family protease n=1 Tax=Sporomusa sp. KB1 TaxID=943346 RepID=UPI001C9576D7|nr:ATP-dependent Clp protease proteolytic subunit [Sporomusa sp. KB1]
MAVLSCESIDAILKKVDEWFAEGCNCIHLMISTPGGSVANGISLANYLRGIPIEVNTYNFGAVDSMGVAVFCAGTRRFCTPQSRFLIHPICLSLLDNQSIDEQFLARKTREIEVDTRNVAGIISERTSMSINEIINAMRYETIFDAQEALKYGLVDEIRPVFIPQNARLYTIYSDCSAKEHFPKTKE